MAPKSGKATVSKGKSTEVPKPTFISKEANHRYKTSIVGRKCIQERGIVDPRGSLRANIQARGWGEFVKQPEAALVPVVREFYANAKEHNQFQVLVRGKQVPFDSHTINSYYNLPDIEEDEYSKLLIEGPSYEQIISFLATPETEWVMSGQTVLRFPAKRLHLTGKVWHYFISAKFLPTSHFSGVSRERAVLNYAIQQGLSIDVGKVIQHSIEMIAQMSTVGGFGHPSLIYDLCIKAGVWTSPTEEIQHPKPPLTSALIRKLAKESQADEEGDDPEPQHKKQKRGLSSSGQAKEQTTTEASPVIDPAVIARMERGINLAVGLQLEMKREMKALKARVDMIALDNRKLHQYLIDAVTSMGTDDMPSPVRLPVYPPPTPETSHDEEEDSSSSSDSAGSKDEEAAS